MIFSAFVLSTVLISDDGVENVMTPVPSKEICEDLGKEWLSRLEDNPLSSYFCISSGAVHAKPRN